MVGKIERQEIKMSERIYIGMDPSLSGFGIVVFDGEDVSSYELKGSLPKNASCAEKTVRVIKMIDGIKESLRCCGASTVGRKSMVCIEAYAVGLNPMASLVVAELMGVIKVTLLSWYWDICHRIAPSQLKKFATGSGKGSKAGIMLAVYKRWGYDCNGSDNIADAYVLAQIAKCFYEPEGFTKGQQELVAKIKKQSNWVE